MSQETRLRVWTWLPNPSQVVPRETPPDTEVAMAAEKSALMVRNFARVAKQLKVKREFLSDRKVKVICPSGFLFHDFNSKDDNDDRHEDIDNVDDIDNNDDDEEEEEDNNDGGGGGDGDAGDGGGGGDGDAGDGGGGGGHCAGGNGYRYGDKNDKMDLNDLFNTYKCSGEKFRMI
ncbi:hypothetical protein ElyMa_003056600 [Elysia marginata]|uniref:Uncharacterized protein n=1 Tax=Elysia marginata TaxID=1093978 RepID=A0AAV4IKU4_9GAST|nr:hypothetical protein ElyMa_003056600 [Elysia marginata]